MVFDCIVCFLFCVLFFILQYWLVKEDRLDSADIWIKLGEGIISFLTATLIPGFYITMITSLYRLNNRQIQGSHPETIYESGEVDVIFFILNKLNYYIKN